MLHYAISDRKGFAGDEIERQDALVRQAERWAAEGIDFVQLREKDLDAGALAALARRLVEALGETRLLVNSRADVAIAVGAAGVHLTSAPGGLTPAHIRDLYDAAGLPEPLVSVACHTLPEVGAARKAEATHILFSPVFAKTLGGVPIRDGVGLDALRLACESAWPTPVLALGGITRENVADCLAAGAAGVAGIRLYTSSKD